MLTSHFCFQIGQARFRAPEVLFRPDLLGEECEGIHDVLMYAIEKSDMDLRKMLYQNIVLSGGSTLFKGFGDRLLSELRKHSSKDLKIRVSTLNDYSFINKNACCHTFCVFPIDCCAPGTSLLHVDGWIHFGIVGYFQKDVDLKERVRGRRPASCA